MAIGEGNLGCELGLWIWIPWIWGKNPPTSNQWVYVKPPSHMVFGQPLIRAVVDANFSADMVLYWDEVVLKYFKGMTCRFPSMWTYCTWILTLPIGELTKPSQVLNRKPSFGKYKVGRIIQRFKEERRRRQ